jgi:hypothetical protein
MDEITKSGGNHPVKEGKKGFRLKILIPPGQKVPVGIAS